jgi:hypothetical protein
MWMLPSNCRRHAQRLQDVHVGLVVPLFCRMHADTTHPLATVTTNCKGVPALEKLRPRTRTVVRIPTMYIFSAGAWLNWEGSNAKPLSSTWRQSGVDAGRGEALSIVAGYVTFATSILENTRIACIKHNTHSIRGSIRMHSKMQSKLEFEPGTSVTTAVSFTYS